MHSVILTHTVQCDMLNSALFGMRPYLMICGSTFLNKGGEWGQWGGSKKTEI